MTIVDLPDRPIAAEIEWKLSQPSVGNRSEFSGSRRTTILPRPARWSASVRYPTIVGERAVRPWRAALAALRGRVNAFRLVACERAQHDIAVTVVVDGGGQTGSQLRTRGWAFGVELEPGMFLTLADRLHQITAVTVTGAVHSFAIVPELARPTTDGAAIVTDRPYAVMALTTDEAGWTVSPGQEYAIALACEEAF